MKIVAKLSIFLFLGIMFFGENAQAFIISGNPPLYDDTDSAFEVALSLGKTENTADYSGQYWSIDGKLGKKIGSLGIALNLRYHEDDLRCIDGSDRYQAMPEFSSIGLIVSIDMNTHEDSNDNLLLYGSFLIGKVKGSDIEITGATKEIFDINNDFQCGAIGIQWEGRWKDGSGYVVYSQIGITSLTEDDFKYDYASIKLGVTIYAKIIATGFDIEQYEDIDSDFSITRCYGSVKFFF